MRQPAQYNFVRCLLLAALVCGPVPVAAGTPPRDALLDDGPPGPCSDLATGPEYAAGTDVNGNPVVPADVGAAAVPMPDAIAVPLAGAGRGGRVRPNPMGQGAFAEFDGSRLSPLVNPPGCPR